MIKIPPQALSREALITIIEEFVLREGTDYGHRDYVLEGKVAQVLRQLESGEVHLTWDPATQSTSIVNNLD
ncbi:MAG: YheU family protein [Pseudomonadales bacterium]|nr:YheU family protein [Pseudomonadales bacterium]MDP6471959.1 YheU family protein [Pseudomonadales bacterium]MDP6826770.1 YheU family protein [Pseudomonadales bacterium]